MIEFKQKRENDKVYVELKSNIKLTEFAIRRAWFKVGADMLRTANKSVLKKPRQGRLYVTRMRDGRRRRHRASKPFESHANFSGALRRSMQWKVSGTQLRFGYGIANANAPEYGTYLEFGTGKLKPRPTLQNAIEGNERNAEQHLIEEVNKEFN